LNSEKQHIIHTINIGIVGAGSFAAFAASAFLQLRGVNLIAVADVDPNAAKNLAGKYAAVAYPDLEKMLQDESIDLIYIATPPFLHYSQSKASLVAGKHVLCEKPAALKLEEAKELASLAQSKNLLYVVNLMQRYNPLYEIVSEIIDNKTLGEFLHGYFENYASDESLPASHWFWDEAKSGGIFTEHGVHFFDMFSGWLGKGEVIQSLKKHRPGYDNIIDRVQATVMYGGGWVNFYHGFDQPRILDRQQITLLFERGDITLRGWIPVTIKVHGLFNETDKKIIRKLLKENFTENEIKDPNQKAKGRFKDIDLHAEVTFEKGDLLHKEIRYQQLLMRMLADQWSWIKNNKHHRKIDETNGIASLQMALDADKRSAIF
jgi:predicted dehydrogenase